jgi:hypothetical protein
VSGVIVAITLLTVLIFAARSRNRSGPYQAELAVGLQRWSQ